MKLRLRGVKQAPNLYTVLLWINDRHLGTLTLRKDEWKGIVSMLRLASSARNIDLESVLEHTFSSGICEDCSSDEDEGHTPDCVFTPLVEAAALISESSAFSIEVEDE